MTTIDETPVATNQQIAARVLTAVLNVPDLAPATWTVWPDALTGAAQLIGQLYTKYAGDFRMAIGHYADALGLTVDEEKDFNGSETCAAFTKVTARGWYMGVEIEIWGAAR